ncbi:MAG: hypothetical protein LBT92_00115 [Rickettsiales bacterium]|nr:hypothetical protein [Rickettsiales bacterium]
MDENTYIQLRGYRSPSAYSFQLPEPKVVYTPGGLPIPETMFGSAADLAPGAHFYMDFSIADGKFDGAALSNDFIDYPMNNDPGYWKGAKARTVGVGVGAQGRSGTRIDVSYLTMSGLSYSSGGMKAGDQVWNYTVWEDIDYDGTLDFYRENRDDYEVEGGSISVSAVMVNVYFPLADLLENLIDSDFFKTTLVPYVGGGFGYSYNRLGDYAVYDPVGPGYAPIWDVQAESGGEGFMNIDYDEETGDDYSGYYSYDGVITHFGATTKSAAWNIEVGVEYNWTPKTKIDLYYRKTNYGRIASKGDALAEYETVTIIGTDVDVDGVEILYDADGNVTDDDTVGMPDCYAAGAADLGYVYNPDTGWCELEPEVSEELLSGVGESGRLSVTEMGIRLRVIF